MNYRSCLSFLACAALLPLSINCAPSGLEPIGSGSSTSSSSSTTSTGAGGESGTTTSSTGGSPAMPCASGCGSAEICVDGSCHGLVQLDTAVSMNDGVCTIVVDAANVYWKSSDVRRVPRAGGPSTLLDFGTSSPGGLVVDDTYLYWTNFGIQRAEKTAPAQPGTTAGIFYADEGGSPTRMVGDGATLFYLEESAIYKASTSGPPDPQAPPVEFSSTWSSAIGTPIAVDAKSIYVWTEGGSLLTKIDKDDTKAADIAFKGNSKIDDTCGIAVDDSGVYYSTAPTPGKGGIVARAGTGAKSTVIVDESSGANGAFAIDESTVYFMTPSSVMKVAKAGGTPVLVSPLSPPSPFPTCIAVDDTYVYWVDGLKLMRLAK